MICTTPVVCCANTGSSLRTDPFPDDALTGDDFLGGAVRLLQPRDGYRAGADPVLLAASVPAVAGDAVLELGCGAGAALACLGARVPGIEATGVEMMPAYADLARRNLAGAGISGTVHCADLRTLPPEVKSRRFNHVIANPPYFENLRGVTATAPDRAASRAGEIPLSKWVTSASKRLLPGGVATFIQRVDRLPELMSAFHASLGAIELWPIQPRSKRPARLFLLRGRKNARAAFVSHPALVLHCGDTHERDGDSYTQQVSKVLRSPAPLPFPDTKPDQKRQG